MPTSRERTILAKLDTLVRVYAENTLAYDEATYEVTPTDGVLLWEGAALVQDAASNRPVSSDGEVRQLAEATVRVPFEALQFLAEGHIIVVDATGARLQVERVPVRQSGVTARVECRHLSGTINRSRST